MSASDFASITDNSKLCDKLGQLGPVEEDLEFLQYGVWKMIFMELTRTEGHGELGAIRTDLAFKSAQCTAATA